jgi:hypothetical protein
MEKRTSGGSLSAASEDGSWSSIRILLDHTRCAQGAHQCRRARCPLRELACSIRACRFPCDRAGHADPSFDRTTGEGDVAHYRERIHRAHEIRRGSLPVNRLISHRAQPRGRYTVCFPADL